MAGDLEGVRAIVTGASRGVGRSVAEAFLQADADVVGIASSPESLDSLERAAANMPGRLERLSADLGIPGEAMAVGREAAALLGRVDVLVNNAGILGSRGPLADQPIGEWERVIAVNLTGLLALTQAVLPAMPDRAAMINVTSGAAGRPTWGAYAVSKLGVDAMTAMFRRELRDRDIRCVTVNPGPARTRMRAAAYPDEDPAGIPHPRGLVAPFLAIARGESTADHIEAGQWTG